MILLLTDKQASKKKFKKVFKVLVSQQVEPFDKQCIPMGVLVPDSSAFADYINGELSADGFYKKYVKSIKKDTELMATFTTLGISYQQNKVIALVCSAEEMQYLYPGMLAEFLHERYGVEYADYTLYKKRKYDLKDIAGELDDDSMIRLCKDAKKYQELIFGHNRPIQFIEEGLNGGGKKKNKKKKKSKPKAKPKSKKKKLSGKKANNIDDFIKSKEKARKKKKPVKQEKFKIRPLSKKESAKRREELISRAKKADKHPNKMIRQIRVWRIK